MMNPTDPRHMDVNFDLQTHLINMEDRLGARMDAGFASHTTSLKELDTRVTKLESWRTYLAGAWAAIGIVLGYKFKT